MSEKDKKQTPYGLPPPNPDEVQKAIAQQLQAKNIGVDKILLNVNGGNSELQTNRNSIIKYSLKQPINLEVGDIITCIQGFVQEQGLAENTISFEEDIEAEMRFTYYKQGNVGDTVNVDKGSDDVSFCQYPKCMPDAFLGTENNRDTLVGTTLNFGGGTEALYNSIAGDLGLNMAYDNKVYEGSEENLTSGQNGQMFLLCETYQILDPQSPFSSDGYYRPCLGKKRIKVKAGNYSVDSLANIITEQMNGSIGADNNTLSDALLDKLYYPDVNYNGTTNAWNTTPFWNNLDVNQGNDPYDANIVGTQEFLRETERQRFDGLVKEMNISQYNYYNMFRINNIAYGSSEPGERNAPGTVYPNGKDTLAPNGLPPKFFFDAQLLLNKSSQSSNPYNGVHFYIGRRHLYEVWQNEENRFYSNPGLADNTMNPNELFRPPSYEDCMYVRLDKDHGIIPPYVSNNANPPGMSGFRWPHLGNALIFNTLWPVNGLYLPDVSQVPYPPTRTHFAGTSVAQLTYSDAVQSRFAFQNFHEFYKLPNLTADGQSTSGFGGQQATSFNNPIIGPYQNTTNEIQGNPGMIPVYPVDSSSGIAINNFDFDLVKDTAVYKDLVSKIQSVTNNKGFRQQLYREKLIFDLFTKPFDQFFASEVDARAAWSKSLWSRLGFSYDQLGNITKNLEQTKGYGGTEGNVKPNLGIITHNEFDFSKIVSSDGLGTGNPIQDKSGAPLQNYELQGYFNGDDGFTLGVAGNQFHLLADSKPINAANLPSLNNGKSYLLIESDIIKPNFKDNKAQWGNLLAIMSKENATNDTIFGAQPIDFTVTESRLLSEITIYIKNPDGTLADDSVIGKNNGFIIQITKPIKPQALPIIDPP
jgi:hypothetical protein